MAVKVEIVWFCEKLYISLSCLKRRCLTALCNPISATILPTLGCCRLCHQFTAAWHSSGKLLAAGKYECYAKANNSRVILPSAMDHSVKLQRRCFVVKGVNIKSTKSKENSFFKRKVYFPTNSWNKFTIIPIPSFVEKCPLFISQRNATCTGVALAAGYNEQISLSFFLRNSIIDSSFMGNDCSP